MSVRLPRADAYAVQVDKEHRWLPVLGAGLPLPIPQPLAKGEPGCGFPRPWSVYRWLPGRHAAADRIDDLKSFAVDLARFLTSLHAVDPTNGPPPGEHNFLRGAPPASYEAEVREAIDLLSTRIDVAGASEVWEAAIASRWASAPVWIHGDLGPTNLLVEHGRLSAVIDFGLCAVGDPACDLVVAWTLLYGASRARFREHVSVDPATWERARGWMLWKALIVEAEGTPSRARELAWRRSAREIIAEVVDDHVQA